MNETKLWKISTIVLACVSVCLLLLLIIRLNVNDSPTLSPSTFSNIQQDPSEPSIPQQPMAPSDNTTNQSGTASLLPVSFMYPSSAFFLASGNVTVDSTLSGTSFENRSFTLNMQPYGESAVPKSFTIPISRIDYVQEPKISYNEKYGCVQVGSSGYWGYYIFTLPRGEKVDQGEQYSNCVEWISDYQVIIAEQPYNTANTIYSILDVRTKQKQVISSFSN